MNGDISVICSNHESQVVKVYCKQCEVAICVVCAAIDHEGHSLIELTDLMGELQGNLEKQIDSADSIVKQLGTLIDEVEPHAASLHQYVDHELGSVEATLEEKRCSLLDEVENRTLFAEHQLRSELELIEQELKTLQTGAAVLEALSKREGMVEDVLGGLICEKMSFDEFMSVVDAPLHEPVKMLEMLALQLPTQSLQEVCDLISWTGITAEPTQQIFPVSTGKMIDQR